MLKNLILFFIFIISQSCSSGTPNPQSPLRAYFEFIAIEDNKHVLEPTNLNFVQEYYLLENLGMGLVRDNPEQVNGYDPAIAINWERIDDKKWIFKIRPDLKWSNGEPITPEELVSHFNSLKEVDSRHIVQLNELDDVSFDKTNNHLILTFKQETNDGLLHELSLADTVLVPPNWEEEGWRVTSGPYFMKRINWESKKMTLIKNPYCLFVNENTIETVELIGVQSFKNYGSVIKDEEIDFFRMGGYTFYAPKQNLIKQSAKQMQSVPANIHHFVFNKKNEKVKNLEYRRAIAQFIALTFKSINPGEYIQALDQMIPKGFEGRLDASPEFHWSLDPLKGEDVIISIPIHFKELGEVLEKVRKIAKDNEINIKLNMNKFHYLSPPEEVAAYAVMFKGNQKDPLGSWKFLLSDTGAYLGDLQKYSKATFKEISSAHSKEHRMDLLKKLHRKALEGAYFIPFWLESSLLLLSDRVNADGINMFDMRSRYYQLRWEEN